MKKYKYQTLTKEEKRKAKNDFYRTDNGKNLKKRFDRLFLYSILLTMFAIYIVISAIINDDAFYNYIYGISLFVMAIIFLIGRYKIYLENINNFIVKK